MSGILSWVSGLLRILQLVADQSVTVRVSDSILGSLRGPVKVSFADGHMPSVTVSSGVAQRWADQHANEIAAALNHPPLIIPTSAIVRSPSEPSPFLPRIWRLGKTKGSVGRLRTWLFMWWLAQSDLGGVEARYAGGVLLLRPFVENQPVLGRRVEVEWSTGEIGSAELNLPKVELRRRLDEHVSWLNREGFIRAMGRDPNGLGAWTLGSPSRHLHATDGSPFTPLILDDCPRYRAWWGWG